ncbi:MAG: type IV pilin protein [Elusimicrobiaceae bacterium]|nr:type IV pilin protein [Elusimicrobiaceae bacterium]
MAIIRSVAAAQENYYLANGTYATNFDELAVDIPWTGTTRWIAGASPTDGVRSNEDWSVQIFREASGKGIAVGRLSGPYAGAGFMYLLDKVDYNFPTRTMLCVENQYEGDGSVIFQQHSGNYCKKIMKGTYIGNDRWQL